MLSDRQNAIMEIARSDGRVLVEALAGRFAVSVQTIRKDLNDLCEARLLSRMHGGAVLGAGAENLDYDSRNALSASEKSAIARAVSDLIPDRSSLFINIGTTTEAVARALLGHSGLMVITNNLNVAHALRPSPEVECIVAGGLIRRSDGGIVGEAAVDFIRQFKVDFAVIGASAIDEDGSLLDFDYREVRVAQAIIANARHVVLVADSTKFERSAPVRLAQLNQIGTFVTDHCPSDSLRDLCRASGVRLIETGR